MCACGFALALAFGPPSWPPGSGARALREDHPEMLFSRAWKQSVRDVEEEGLPRGGRGTEPASACKAVFGRTWGGLPVGEGQFCSEAPQARGRAQHGPCPWPALPRHSWPPRLLPQEEAGCGECQTCPGASLGSAP